MVWVEDMQVVMAEPELEQEPEPELEPEQEQVQAQLAQALQVVHTDKV